MEPLREEKQLLIQIAQGDELAFVKVFRHYQDHIFKVAIDFVKSHALAEEVVQDIFVKVWQRRDILPSLDSFNDWLFIISRNYLVTYLKRLAKEKEVRQQWATEQPLYEDSTDYRLREQQFAAILKDIINGLPQQQGKVFKLAKEQYMTYAQIAEELGISPNTVRIHMSRALENVRKSLRDRGIVYLLFFVMNYPFIKF